MSTPGGGIRSQRAQRIRDAFDRSFAEAPRPGRAPGAALVLIGVGNTPCCVYAEECGGVAVTEDLVLLPSPVPDFRGFAVVGGIVTPVYDLAVRLSMPAAGPRAALIVLSAGAHRAGFLIDALDGYTTVAGLEGPASFDGETIVVGEHARQLVRLSRIVDQIAKEARRRGARRSGAE